MVFSLPLHRQFLFIHTMWLCFGSSFFFTYINYFDSTLLGGWFQTLVFLFHPCCFSSSAEKDFKRKGCSTVCVTSADKLYTVTVVESHCLFLPHWSLCGFVGKSQRGGNVNFWDSWIILDVTSVIRSWLKISENRNRSLMYHFCLYCRCMDHLNHVQSSCCTL